MIETCDRCRNDTTDTTLEWVPDDGWRGVCQACRMVATLTESGRLKFIRIGGQ